MRVHLDRVPLPEAPAKIIALHGGGGYGRMLASYGRLPALAGMEFLAPDLPGFGLTSHGRLIDYGTWVRCVRDLIEHELDRDARPIVLLGFGIGGRLAYDAAASSHRSVAGVVATALLDPRQADVRRYLAARLVLGQYSGLLTLLPRALRQARLPIRWLANVAAMANQAQFAQLVWADPLGGGGRVPLSLVRGYLTAAPALAPEMFKRPPVLLVTPSEDRWTPPGLSLRFFHRIAAPKRFAMLHGAGHLPVEESGLAELDQALRDFLDELHLG
jgi:alpha-beta hydrolase superfamily lysophospholipase